MYYKIVKVKGKVRGEDRRNELLILYLTTVAGPKAIGPPYNLRIRVKPYTISLSCTCRNDKTSG